MKIFIILSFLLLGSCQSNRNGDQKEGRYKGYYSDFYWDGDHHDDDDDHHHHDDHDRHHDW